VDKSLVSRPTEINGLELTCYPRSQRLNVSRRGTWKVMLCTFSCSKWVTKATCFVATPHLTLVVLRRQATIHMSLPRHQNIVTLYQTLQTRKWLFLLLEMCPGEDLYVPRSPDFVLIANFIPSYTAFTGSSILEIRRHPAPLRTTIPDFATSRLKRIPMPETSHCRPATYHPRRYRSRPVP
jgi:hypothetical protein